ncbi:MAG TPA: hypothetical protein VHK02_05815 [Actinomycetota bacterium]|jgi:hypothetical protein|nr:hypothetical protein [Actinomycetota bacterium]
MPPEQDDNRDRQLAALRRYVSDLDVRRQHAAGQARPEGGRRRGPWPWLLATVLLMAVALAGGIAIGASLDRGDRQPGRATGPGAGAAPSTSVAAPTATPECVEAVARANASLRHAVAMAGALRKHTEIMNDLLNGKLDAEAAVRKGTPSLIAGSAESAKFDVALADYRRVVDRCRRSSS